MAFSVGLALICAVIGLIYALVKRNYRYWSNRNVPTLEPSFPFGNFGDLRYRSPAEVSSELYHQMDPRNRFYGLFITLQPTLMLTDPELIKTVLIRDFATFPDHGIYLNESVDPLSAHLFAMEGARWKATRSKLSPTFTAGRMRAIFPILQQVAQNFKQFLCMQVGEHGAELDVKDYSARMMIDNIGSCAFGVECNSFRDPDSAFRRSGRLAFENPRHSQLVSMMLRLYPWIGHALGLKVFRDEVIEFFSQLLEETVALRERSNGIKRNDLMDLMIEVRAREGVENASTEGLSMDELKAQTFGFFVAGYDTSASNVTFCLYELALNEECQERARTCVLEALQKHGGMTYEAIADMEYLDRCINETLRKYPPLAMLQRTSCKPYRIPDSDVILPTKMKILIPIYAIQRDARYYPDPEQFVPDRFTLEAIAGRHMCTFLPFGEGPRICIGKRLGMIQSRVGIATVLANFRIRPGPNTPIPLVYAKDSVTIQNRGSVMLQFEPLKGMSDDRAV
ncbi:probable cytochrome P450 6a13 isoform X1 [Anopheles darlingi]|uniref:probable cytochrome P450 6a13 isoform X1 n=1 Tax=Anopheles darlingi TaxID=43151 RepID=UPI002100645E|nr:probable cytochrome P450 6a13 isoform X1 [Anopheles darlingi]